LLSERLTAPALYRVLQESASAITAGGAVAAVLEKGRKAIADAGFRLDYLEARHADTLAPLAASGHEPIRLLVAARLGNTRLIDNVAV
jgi:pantoate--beta-alanine ligase